MTARKDLTGRKFGRLLVVEYVETNHNYKTIWLCKCDCGNEGNFIGNQLLSGHTQSCGCLHSEMLSKRSKTHGLSKNRACAIWYGMMRRCYNKEQSGYERYGGRGITAVSYTHLRAHETPEHLVCRLLLEKKKKISCLKKKSITKIKILVYKTQKQ